MNRRLSRLTIPGPVGSLQAVLQEHEGREPEVVAVVCHPHPLYGGTLDNKVAHRIATNREPTTFVDSPRRGYADNAAHWNYAACSSFS